MTVNLQYIFMSSLISEKNKWLSNERKRIIFESIGMAGALRRLFKPYRQALLNAK